MASAMAANGKKAKMTAAAKRSGGVNNQHRGGNDGKWRA